MSIVCVDDEPADGPQHYVIITGFYEPFLLMYLDEIGIAVDCIIQLDSKLTLPNNPPAGRYHMIHVTVFIFDNLSSLNSQKFEFIVFNMHI